MEEYAGNPTAVAIGFVVFGIFGHLSSIALALCLNNKSSPTLSLAAILNHMLWILYSLLFGHPNHIPVITSSLVGCFIIITHLLFYAKYKTSWYDRRKVVAIVVLDIIIVGAIAGVVLSVVHGTELRLHIVGTIAIICHIGMFASPVSDLGLVIKTRTLDHLDQPLAYASLANCTIWFIYAGVSLDIYLIVPNALGFILGMVQYLFIILMCGGDLKASLLSV